MKIVKPKVKYWEQGENKFDHIAKCARICYASDKTTNNEAMVNALVRNGHKSMLRHWSVYLKFSDWFGGMTRTIINIYFVNNPFCGFALSKNDRIVYISTNEQYYREIYEDILRLYDVDISEHLVPEEEIKNTFDCKNIVRYTMFVQTSIDISRELNRVSPNNIAEQSTRYVEQGSICESHFYDIIYDEVIFDNINLIANGEQITPLIRGNNYCFKDVYSYLLACQNSFDNYNTLLNNGFTKEDARKVLPLATTTKCVYTYNLEEWKHILNLRLYGITGRPHPDAKIIGQLIKEQFYEIGVEV